MVRREIIRPRMPIDIETNLSYKEACLKLYKFWVGLLDEKIKPEERLNRAEEFLERNFNNGVASWLFEDDPSPFSRGKSRAVFIKELAYSDWEIVHGKRHNEPSVYFRLIGNQPKKPS